MKKTTTLFLLSLVLLQYAKAQTNKAFAITSENKGGLQWTSVKELDLTTGNVLKNIYTANDNVIIKTIVINKNDIASYNINNLNKPTQFGVAATAFDAKHNRLYFSQMWGNDLRYFDLNENQIAVVINQDKNYSTGDRTDESKVITRMAFAANGYGYAISNDGNQFIQFSTDENPTITNLGALIDSKKNTNISIHNQCTSWGGDIIADVYGNLYLFTIRNHVFKININTRIAEYMGAVKNLPNDFTINGAAVNANGDVFVSSAILTNNYYTINLSTLQASPVLTAEGSVFNASDLANENFAYQNTLSKPTTEKNIFNNNIAIFPNPVINKTFSLQFNNISNGKYYIEITDVNNNKIYNSYKLIKGIQNEKIELSKSIAAGYYFIKVLDEKGKIFHSEKKMIQ